MPNSLCLIFHKDNSKTIIQLFFANMKISITYIIEGQTLNYFKNSLLHPGLKFDGTVVNQLFEAAHLQLIKLFEPHPRDIIKLNSFVI